MSLRLVVKALDAQFGRQSWKVVCVKLAECANDDGSSIFPSRETIARVSECSVVTVKRIIAIFKSVGLLKVVRAGGRGRGSTTEYAMNVALLDELAQPGSPNLLHRYEQKRKLYGLGGHDDPLSEPFRGSWGTEKGVMVIPQPCQDPVKHYTTARASPSVDNLNDRLREAAGQALATSAPKLANLAVVFAWLEAGHDLETVILPAIRAKAETVRAGSVKVWSYFTGPIEDWVEQSRIAGQSGRANGKVRQLPNGRWEIFRGSQQWARWEQHARRCRDEKLLWRLQRMDKTDVPSEWPQWI